MEAGENLTGAPTPKEYRAWREKTDHGENLTIYASYPDLLQAYYKRYDELLASGNIKNINGFCVRWIDDNYPYLPPIRIAILYRIAKKGSKKWQDRAYAALLRENDCRGLSLRYIIRSAPLYWRGEACKKLLKLGAKDEYRWGKFDKYDEVEKLVLNDDELTENFEYSFPKFVDARCDHLCYIIEYGPPEYQAIALTRLINKYTSGKTDNKVNAVTCFTYINNLLPEHLRNGFLKRLLAHMENDDDLYELCCQQEVASDRTWQVKNWERLLKNGYSPFKLLKCANNCFIDSASVKAMKELTKLKISNNDLCNFICKKLFGKTEWRIWALERLLEQTPTIEELCKIIVYGSKILERGDSPERELFLVLQPKALEALKSK